MSIKTFMQAKTGMYFLILVFAFLFSSEVFSQKNDAEKPSPAASATPLVLPKVTQIDNIALKKLIKPNGKPLLINFWATWCDPCREEFPDLVQIGADYKNKIDFITISMDDLAEISRDVPKFLAEMKAEMPAYLLKSQSEDVAVMSVSKNWQGGLPFTILFNEKGETVYFRQGKVKIDILRAAIDKIVVNQIQSNAFNKGKTDAQKDLANGKFSFKTNSGYRLKGLIRKLKETYGITIEFPNYSFTDETFNRRSVNEELEYAKGYNSVSEIEIGVKFGDAVLKEIKERFIPNYPADVTEIKLTIKQKP